MKRGGTKEAEDAAEERGKVAVANRADEIAAQLDQLNAADAAAVVQDFSPFDKGLAKVVESEGKNRKTVLAVAGDDNDEAVDALQQAREARGDFDEDAEGDDDEVEE